MKMKLATLALVGILAIGGTVSAFAASNNTAPVGVITSPKAITAELQKEQVNENDEKELTAVNTKTVITEDQAKQAALSSVKDAVFKAIELEDEDGVIVYGVEIQSGSNSYDVKVDANTGSIIKTDQGNDSDDKSSIVNESKSEENDNIQHENDNEDPDGYED